jgi:FkbM family methyltransferase
VQVGELNRTIINMQAVLHTKVGEANQVIRDLQAELQAQQMRLGERDQTIHALQAEVEKRTAELTTIRQSRSWRLLSHYWRLRQKLRRGPLRPAIPLDAAHWLYQRILAAYQAPATGPVRSAYRRLVEWLICLAVVIVSRRRHMRFPPKAIGGWYYIWRFRFELLMSWFEYDSVRWCRHLVRPGMTVVDVGAHIGYYSRLLSEMVGSQGQVLAFEPDPENFATLTSNLSPPRYSNVQAFNCALSDRDGVLPLHRSLGNSNHSLLAGYTESQETVEVETVTLDAFLAARGIDRVDFIKIDVEGAEPLVLAGMTRTITHSPDLTMLVEYNPEALRCGDVPPEDMIRSLQDTGFCVQAILPGGTLGDVPETMSTNYFNLLCRRPSNQ